MAAVALWILSKCACVFAVSILQLCARSFPPCAKQLLLKLKWVSHHKHWSVSLRPAWGRTCTTHRDVRTILLIKRQYFSLGVFHCVTLASFHALLHLSMARELPGFQIFSSRYKAYVPFCLCFVSVTLDAFLISRWSTLWVCMSCMSCMHVPFAPSQREPPSAPFWPSAVVLLSEKRRNVPRWPVVLVEVHLAWAWQIRQGVSGMHVGHTMETWGEELVKWEMN